MLLLDIIGFTCDDYASKDKDHAKYVHLIELFFEYYVK